MYFDFAISVIRPKKRALKYDLAVSPSHKVGENVLFVYI